MNLEATLLATLETAPASGGKLIERLQALESPVVAGRAALVYGALANLAARGEIVVVDEGPGERVYGVAGGPPARAASQGFPPSFSLGAAELSMVDRELAEMTRGLAGPYFEELRRAVVASADRRVFHGAKLPGAVTQALGDLGPPGGVRPFLRKVERGGPVELRMHAALRRRWLVIPIVVVALLLLLRLFVVGVYTVPAESISMAPALIPAAEQGDRFVLANLLAYRFGDPERGDMAILTLPFSDAILVKRVMGLPGETIAIKEGDLFLDGKRLVKERALLDRVKVPLLTLDDYRREASPAGWQPPKEPLLEQYRLPDGERSASNRKATDAVVFARLRTGAEPRSITFQLDVGRSANHLVVMATGGAGSISVAGTEVMRGTVLRLEPEREYEVWLTNADRLFRVQIDGRTVAEAPVLRARKVRLTVFFQGDVELTELSVARDLAYRPPKEAGALKLGEDQYYVLGDNSENSRDSRMFKAVDRAAFLGRIVAVAWPPGRVRRVR